jgi:tetratricopeptide (TPR) repeat protein
LPLQQERLTERIARAIPPAERERVVSFLGELCDIPFPDETNPALHAARHDSNIMRDGLRRAAFDWLRKECAATPVLLILDDLQWGDSLTISLLDDALHELHDLPLFVLAFARPELHETFPKLFTGHSLQLLSLKPLSKRACERLIQQVIGTEIPAEIVAGVVEHSGGNALFLEELIRATAEGKSDETPQTVIAMLQARIGRLDAGPRRSIRAAAIFGQTFCAGGIAALLGVPKTALEVEHWLAVLVEEELVSSQASTRVSGEKEYSFRHALVKDAVYSLLTPSDLCTGHRLAAEFLESIGEEDVAAIAEHFERGCDKLRAIAYHICAAEQCLEHHDLQGVLRYSERGLSCGAEGEAFGILSALQASAHMLRAEWAQALKKGMEAISTLPSGTPSWLRTIGQLFLILSQFMSVEPTRKLAALYAAVDPDACEPRAYLYSALFQVYVFISLGNRAGATAFLEKMKQRRATLAERDIAARGFIHLAESWYSFYLEADVYAGYLSTQQATAAFAQVEDLRNLCMAKRFVGFFQARLGLLEEAEQTLQACRALAGRLQEPLHIMLTELFMAAVLIQGVDRVPDCYIAAIAIADKLLQEGPSRLPIYIGLAQAIRGRSLLAKGQLAEAEQAARIGSQELLQAPTVRPRALATLAEVLLRQGRNSEARQTADEALEIAERCGGLGYSDMLARVVAAEARHADGDVAGAHAVLIRALERLKLAAENIPDAWIRRRFLTDVMEHARAQQLAVSFGLPFEIK